jgi:hypothetical protein
MSRELQNHTTGSTEEIYRSPNGDRWTLLRNGASAIVRHEPNPASGGRPSDMDAEAFLATPGNGPEKQALRRMLRDIATSVQIT